MVDDSPALRRGITRRHPSRPRYASTADPAALTIPIRLASGKWRILENRGARAGWKAGNLLIRPISQRLNGVKRNAGMESG